MAQPPRLDFEAFVARKKAERAGGDEETTGHEYTYTFDRQSRIAFENTKPVALAVEASVRLFKQVGKHQLLGHAVKVSDRQFPRIYRITKTGASSRDSWCYRAELLLMTHLRHEWFDFAAMHGPEPRKELLY